VIEGPLRVLLAATAVGAGTMAGLFATFSVVVMPALDRVPASAAIAVMQATNRVIITPLFLVAFLGSGLGAVVLAVAAVAGDATSGEVGLLVAAALAYVVGVLGVTGRANVPRNDALDGLDADAASAASDWAAYRIPWTAWNHVRSLAAAAATTLLVLAA
jgi:uncharacterized membrane protein